MHLMPTTEKFPQQSRARQINSPYPSLYKSRTTKKTSRCHVSFSRPPRCHVTSFSATRQTFLRQRIDASGNGQGVIPRTLSFSPFSTFPPK
ncbi:hypothetical protein E2C01_049950 [Portunus trituberculatus]|uniref:Uncharacterized protein n=1 Tax=Portunus trituberculatus TaxID=210409 RepID=A0A5B7GAT0_PORTR|nr:hypothetical protein [Portunus trituberculatus]